MVRADRSEGGVEKRRSSEDEAERNRRKADLDAAIRPQSGAAISSAFAGANIAAEKEDSESEKELKRAARQNSD